MSPVHSYHLESNHLTDYQSKHYSTLIATLNRTHRKSMVEIEEMCQLLYTVFIICVRSPDSMPAMQDDAHNFITSIWNMLMDEQPVEQFVKNILDTITSLFIKGSPLTTSNNMNTASGDIWVFNVPTTIIYFDEVRKRKKKEKVGIIK